MWNTFKYTLLWLLRNPGIMVWSLLFPLVLTSVFIAMFGPLDDMAQLEPLRVGVVQPDDSAEGQAFEAFIDATSEGDDRLLDPTFVTTADDAAALVRENADTDEPYVGYVKLDQGEPQAYVIGNVSTGGLENLESSILALMLDEYAARAYLAQELARTDPAALADPTVIEALFEPIQATVQVHVTDNQPKESTRFYFALLGMAALFGGSMGLTACRRLKANTSALGARRTIGATNYARTVVATLAASWLLSFACLSVAFAYMEIAGGVNFAGREGACLTVVAAASLVATALGCALSAIPRIPEDGKNGILAGVVCFASLFAGLYGQPTMELADTISAAFPVADIINPATQISQAFYSIMYYDTIGPLMGHLGILCTMSILLFLVSAASLRRQRYASI